MRILHVVTRLDLGGAEQSLLKYLQRWPNPDTQHVVIDLMGGGALGDSFRALGVGVEDLGVRLSRPGWPRGVFRAARLVRKFKPDLIAGWMYQGNLFASALGCLGGTPVLWNIRHSLDDLGREGLRRRVVLALSVAVSGTVSLLLYNSAKSRQTHESLGMRGSRADVIPNGFDLERFRPDTASRARIRTEFGIPQSCLVVGTIARNHPDKGYDVLLDAMAPLIEANPSVHLLCVGDGTEVDVPPFSAQVGRPWVKNLHLPGPRTDIEAILAALDVYVSPSHTESFPNVVGEAMATAVPVVATNVGDCGLLLGCDARLVEPGNAAALRLAVEELLGGDAQQAGVAAHAGRRRIEDYYALDGIAKRFCQACESLVN